MRHWLYTNCLLCCSLFFWKNLPAQSLEIGGFLGVSHYMGDLQRAQFEILEAHLAKGLFTRYNINNMLALKAQYYQGEISGSDANYQTLEGVWQRNLSFQSTLKEGTIQAEISLLRFGVVKRHYHKRFVSYLTAAYGFVGLSGFYFNPQANYQGEWVDLQPLGTEGQGMPGYAEKYKKFQFAIPAGFGFKINPTRWSSLGFEVGVRTTFTDYLDDVSQSYPDIEALREINPVAAALSYRSPEVWENASKDPSGNGRGNPAVNDFYFFGGLMVSIALAQ
jgi:hypothetical protein